MWPVIHLGALLCRRRETALCYRSDIDVVSFVYTLHDSLRGKTFLSIHPMWKSNKALNICLETPDIPNMSSA